MRVLAFVAVVAATGWAAAAPNLKDRPGEFQKKADATSWEWSDKRATLPLAVRADGESVLVESRPANPVARPEELLRLEVTVQARALGGPPITFRAHRETPVAAAGPVLYYADFDPTKPGGAVVAVDLRDGRELWRVKVPGVPPALYAGYSTRLALDVDGEAVRVWGQEKGGRYVEYLHRASGERGGRKVFPKD